MATPTYIPLATVTLAASSSTVYFTEISQDYSDLILVVNGACTPAGDDPRILLNGDAGGNYANVFAYGLGNNNTGSSSSNDGQNRIDIGSGSWSNTFNNLFIAQFCDYSATDKHTTVLIRGQGSQYTRVAMQAARWKNTAAVTSMTVKMPAYAFAAGTTFKLFGIHGEVV